MPRREFMVRLAAASGLAATLADPVWAAVEKGFRFGRLKVDSCDWYTDFAGVGLPGSSDVLFLERLAANTTIRATPEELSFPLESPLLFQTPLLVLHSHLPIRMTPAQLERVRTAIERGAFLWIEDCGGTEAFDQAARDLIRQLLPRRPLEALDGAHDVFRCCFTLPAEIAGDKPNRGPLEGITQDGRLALLYTRADFHCAWEGHACRPGGEAQRDDAFRFGMNLVTYVLTH